MFDKLDVMAQLKRDDYYKKLIAMAPEQDRERIEKIVEQFIMSVQNPLYDLNGKIEQLKNETNDIDIDGVNIVKD